MENPKKSTRWKTARRVMIILPALLLTLFVISFMVLGNASQTRPDNLGIHFGRLAPLAPTPNGVSSQSANAAHFIEPLRGAGSAAENLARLKELLRRQPRATVIKETDRYLHAEFRSALFRFVDDVEFLIEDEVIHVRSASRVGKSDLGVNRKRIESLRVRFNKVSP